MYTGMSLTWDNCDSYADALKYWTKTKPWRGETEETDERPLKHRRYRNTGVRKRPDGAILFRLHSTDVVTFWPDNSVTVHVYNSVTTAEFINKIGPSWMTASFSSRGTSGLLEIRSRIYPADSGDRVTIQADRTVTGVDSWRRYVVNRKRSNAVRKDYRLREMRMFVEAALALKPGVRDGEPSHPVFDHWHRVDADVRDFARCENLWSQLLHLSQPLSWLNDLEKVLIRRHALDKSEPVEWLSGWREVETYRRAARQWGDCL